MFSMEDGSSPSPEDGSGAGRFVKQVRDVTPVVRRTVPEHPGWEDLIELKNIEQEIDEIEHDIQTL